MSDHDAAIARLRAQILADVDPARVAVLRSAAPRAPQRIQLRRSKGWRKPAAAIVVARPTQYGNRYVVGREIEHIDGQTVLVRDRAHAVELYRAWLDWQIARLRTMRAGLMHDLRGKDLACWCPIGQPCHADVLLEIANAPPRRCEINLVEFDGSCSHCGAISGEKCRAEWRR